METVAHAISRVRNTLKTVKEDPFMTDRYIYSLINKYAKTLIKRESIGISLYKHKSLFKELSCVDLIEVDRVEACCLDVNTGCIFMRSKEKLPNILSVDSGPVIRSVSSLDYSESVTETQPMIYSNLTKTSSFKYNKSKYYWFLDNHIYIPNVTWEAVRVSAIFDEDITGLGCSSDPTKCINEQDRELLIPEHLFSEIEQMVRQEILTAGQIPSDGADDGQNIMR